jgi:hypothetical protein
MVSLTPQEEGHWSAELIRKDHNLLVSELQALIVESKRRYPDVKDVSLGEGLTLAQQELTNLRLERMPWSY